MSHKKSKLRKLKRRAKQIIETKVKYKDHPSFRDAKERKAMRVPLPAEVLASKLSTPNGAPFEKLQGRAGTFGEYGEYEEVQLLSLDEEYSLHRQMNFFFFSCAQSRAQLKKLLAKKPHDWKRIAKLVKRYRRDWRNGLELQNHIVRAYSPFVLFLYKRYYKHRFSRLGVDRRDIISEAMIKLIAAVRGFDVLSGFRLTTYASTAIIRELDRLLNKEGKRKELYEDPSSYAFETNTAESAVVGSEFYQVSSEVQSEVRKHLSHLSEFERQVVMRSHGLGDFPEQTLVEIARELGFNRDKIRQVLLSAYRRIKLRDKRDKQAPDFSIQKQRRSRAQ